MLSFNSPPPRFGRPRNLHKSEIKFDFIVVFVLIHLQIGLPGIITRQLAPSLVVSRLLCHLFMSPSSLFLEVSSLFTLSLAWSPQLETFFLQSASPPEKPIEKCHWAQLFLLLEFTFEMRPICSARGSSLLVVSSQTLQLRLCALFEHPDTTDQSLTDTTGWGGKTASLTSRATVPATLR